jgi:hypothetical protein
MAYALHSFPGAQAIADTSTLQKHPLGTCVRGYDPTYGEAEFIYLKGVAATIVGDCVTFDQKNGATVRTVAASKGPCAIAMSANVANQFGWYCLRGAVPAKVAAAVVAGTIPYVTATAGSIDDAVTANQAVGGALFTSADSGGFADVQLSYPTIGLL